VEAIGAETLFAGRLAGTHMIHSRALLGKAFLRRFKKHEALLAELQDAREAGKGWRRVGDPPTRQELEELWAQDLAELAATE
jgi:hypothetical protein